MAAKFARLTAIALIICAVGLGGFGVFRASWKVVNADLPTMERVEVIVNTLDLPLIIAGLALITFFVGESLAQSQIEAQLRRAEISDLMEMLSRLPQVLEAHSAEAPAAKTPPPAAPIERAIPFIATPPPNIPGNGVPQLAITMKDVVAQLKELRDLTMMDDAQRKQRWTVILKQRRETLLAETTRQIQNANWTAAGRALALLEADFPSDASLADFRARIDRGRTESQAKEVSAIRGRVQDLTAIGNWDQAQLLAVKFTENFPENVEGRALLADVERERQVFTEATANRLYVEIKTDIESRRWRRARSNADKLVQMFPEHRRSATLRPQLQTIRDNAEIEERQEQEHRIQELVRAKRFKEAIELAEDVIDDFPGSPQAATLQAMLPKMRELATKDIDIEAESVVQE